MNNSTTEKYYPVLIHNTLVDCNDQTILELTKTNQTIYGSIANSIKNNQAKIDQAINSIAHFFAQNRALAITKEYEQSRSFVEKWIKNDTMNKRQMEIKREYETKLTSAGIQWVLKGGLYVIEKTLDKKNEKTIKKNIWAMCLSYAEKLTTDIEKKPALKAMLSFLHNQLFNKSPKSIDLSFNQTEGYRLFTYNTEDSIKRATLLYYLYSASHFMSYDYATKEKDLQNMLNMWMEMGIFGDAQEELLKKLECLNIGNAFEFDRVNKLIHSFYNNLSISIPNIDRKIAREINDDLLMYVPNGDKQIATRKAAQFITKGTIAATSSIVGVNTGNPILISSAASFATSLLNDLSNTEVIGNCLRSSGVNENDVKKCLDFAKARKHNYEKKEVLK